MAAALWAEALVLRRSRLVWVTAAAACLIPLVGGLFMLIVSNPDLGARLGLVADKARLMTLHADWPSLFAIVRQALAVGGFLLFGFVTVWVFGRECADGTLADLLALPTSRGVIVVAKFVVAAAWSTLLAALVVLLGVAVGAALGLGGWSASLAVAMTGRACLALVLTLAVVTPFGFAASAGRGYPAGIGALLGALVLAQVLGATGWGPWFPWTVPALAAGVAGEAGPSVGPWSYALVLAIGASGVATTVAWWNHADHTG